MASLTKNINNDSDDENDTLAELNDFLDGDHAGQRLADFLTRKRGLPRIKETVFGGCPLPNFKITGNLKRSITPPPKTDTVVSTVTVQNKSPLNVLSPINKSNAENIERNKTAKSPIASPSKSLESNVLPQPVIFASPKQNSISSQAVQDEVRRSVSKSPVCTSSPRRRSSCYSDKLRRSAIRRRSLFAHRRQLLTEFEDSPEDFEPQISSTPVELTQLKTPTRISQPLYDDPGSSAGSEIVMENLKRCDQQLRRMVDEAVEHTIQQAHERSIPANSRTPSPQLSRPSSRSSQRQRTYTVEKGATPGQVVLTPTKTMSEQEVATKSQSIKIRSPVVRLHNISKVVAQTSTMRTPPRTPSERSLVLNTPIQTIPPILPQIQSEEIIPETQDVPQSPHEQLTSLLSKKDTTPMVVIPVYQTFNGPPTTPTHASNTIAQEKSLRKTPQMNTTYANTSPAKPAELMRDEASRIECGVQTQNNNCCLEPHVNKSIQTSAFVGNVDVDLITDDESMEEPNEISTNQVVNNNSAAPLNLATGVTSPKRHTRQRMKLHRQLLEEEHERVTVNNDSNAVLNLRSRPQRNGLNKVQNKPLNKAPNTPINGEKFAYELARMTNYEILDLRKRNSMGKIFPICGRKSIADEHERVNLEKHIDVELKRRNLSTQKIDEQQQCEQDVNGTKKEHEKTAVLPAPIEFEDASLSSEHTYNCSNNTLRTQIRRSRRWRQRAQSLPMSQTLQNFLNATKNLQERKNTLKANQKRSLYTKGNSDSEDTLSPEKIRKLRSNIEIVPSPPGTFKSKNIRLSQLPIVPPPPPVDLSPPLDDLIPPPSTHFDDFIPPPPPSQFSSDSEVHSDKELPVQRKPTPNKRKSRSAIMEKGNEVSMKSFANDPSETICNNEAIETNTTVPPSQMRKSILKRRQSLRVQWNVEKQSNNIVEEQQQIDNANTTEIMEPLRVSTSSPLELLDREHNKSSTAKKSMNVTTAVDVEKALPQVNKGVGTRVEKALPQVETVLVHSTTDTPTHALSDDDDQPSTSRAALNRSKALATAAVVADDALFKKPTNPAPKRTRKKKQNSEEEQDNDQTLRRSKRGQVPLKNTWSFQSKDPTSLFQVLYRKQMDMCLARTQKRHETLKNKSRLSTMSSDLSAQYNNIQPVCTSTPLNPSELPKSDKRKRGHRNAKATKSIDHQSIGLGDTNTRASGIEPFGSTRDSETEIEDVQVQRQPLSIINEEPAVETQTSTKPTKTGKSVVRKGRSKKRKNDQNGENKEIQSTPAEQLNTIFDQLKAASFCEQNTRPPTQEQAQDANNVEKAKETENQIAKSGQSESSRNELIAWLKGFTGNTESDMDNDMFCGMHFSTRGDLIFMDLDGIDYAFYDTKEKGSLGYMRFKPKQVRPAKRAKSYNLHFIVLTGEFIIATSTEQKKNERRNYTYGDMIAINIGSRYSIENLSNDISILMVIKK